MTNHENGPPKKDEAPKSLTQVEGLPHPTPTTNDCTCSTGRCAIGEACRCDVYADWDVCFPAVGSVAEQLRRRRAAAQRLPRGRDLRRDPISRSRW